MVFSLAVDRASSGSAMYQPDGPINTCLGAIGLGSWSTPWLADPNIALYAVIVAALWRQVGYVMVLYLAGLKGIDPVAVRGGDASTAPTAWEQFRYIVLPQLREVNAVVVSRHRHRLAALVRHRVGA